MSCFSAESITCRNARRRCPQLDTQAISHILTDIYPEKQAREALRSIEQALVDYRGLTRVREHRPLTERDVMLITYPDQFRASSERPLATLRRIASKLLKGHFTAIHILPFFPSSSDDGFSVIDYTRVDPALGDWRDMELLAEEFDLMFDAVINHVSAKSKWFEEYLAGIPDRLDYFIEADPDADYSSVTRPRALPLLTRFETTRGPKWVWTTFSADQIDLNYRSVDVLSHVVRQLLLYVQRGARFIRLDAVGYIWKEPGTTCIHLRQTHRIVQLLRAVLDIAAPQTVLLTETNVPHDDNVSYFGDGTNEAHMVYQFALPPLVLHTLHTGDAQKLSAFAQQVHVPSAKATYLNFLASHDGIGLLPARGILTQEEIDGLVELTRNHGGLVSYRDNGDGTRSPYELNISYLNGLSHPDDPDDMKVKRMVVAHSILLTFVGVPAIYVHSLLGSESDVEGALRSGLSRRINRQKLSAEQIELELTTDSLRSQVFSALTRLIDVRRQESAFCPYGRQRTLSAGPGVFALLRGDGDMAILCLHNVTDKRQTVSIDTADAGVSRQLVDLLTRAVIHARGQRLDLVLEPYQVLWLKRAT